MMKMKAAIYVRTSTEEQNIEQQKKTCVEYAKNKDWKYRTFKDKAQSGKVNDRPEWQRMMKKVEKGGFDGLIVQRYDRVTRNLKYGVEWLEWLKKRYEQGFFFHSVYDGEFRYREGSGFNPDDEFIFKLKCLLSEKEVADMKWRQRIGIERAKKEGKYQGGVEGRSWSEK